MSGDLPPSSKVTFFRFDDAAAIEILRPVATEPVNATWLSAEAALDEADLVDAHVGGYGAARRRSQAREGVQHARGKTCLLCQITDRQRSQGREFARFHNHRASRSERSRTLPRHHHDRVVVWQAGVSSIRAVRSLHLPANADRLVQRVGELGAAERVGGLSVDLVCQSGVVPETGHGVDNVAVTVVSLRCGGAV